jgi:tetratricopeptide (TPR) repeat protein
LESLKSLRTILAAIAVAGVLDAPAVAAAPTPTPGPPSVQVETQRHAELGRRHFEHGRYQEAIAEYRKAYELKGDPIFLYEVATCYRQLERNDRALFFYERYQAASPNAANRDEVDRIIAELERRLKNESGIPTPRLPPRDRVLPPSEDTRLESFSLDERRPAPAPAPRWQRWWVWTAVGVVAAGAAAALVFSSGARAAIPTTELGNKRFP